jgi:hypothetical protein
MNISISTWFPLSMAACAAGYMLVCGLKPSKTRALQELPLFLTRVEMAALGDMLNAQGEVPLRNAFPAPAFRSLQCARFYSTLEQVGRINKNARLFYRWASSELEEVKTVKRRSDFGHREYLIESIATAAEEAISCSFWAMIKIRVWLALLLIRVPMFPIPCVSECITGKSEHLISAYERLSGTVGQFALDYERQVYELMIASI